MLESAIAGYTGGVMTATESGWVVVSSSGLSLVGTLVNIPQAGLYHYSLQAQVQADPAEIPGSTTQLRMYLTANYAPLYSLGADSGTPYFSGVVAPNEEYFLAAANTVYLSLAPVDLDVDLNYQINLPNRATPYPDITLNLSISSLALT